MSTFSATDGIFEFNVILRPTISTHINHFRNQEIRRGRQEIKGDRGTKIGIKKRKE